MPLRDVIDVQVYAAEPELTFLVERDGRQLQLDVTRRYRRTAGPRIRRRAFRRQNPRVSQQLRLLLRQHRWRRDCVRRCTSRTTTIASPSSTAITSPSPTWTTADWERIEEQYLSPLYVSVHATEPDVRVGLMHNPRAGQTHGAACAPRGDRY